MEINRYVNGNKTEKSELELLYFDAPEIVNAVIEARERVKNGNRNDDGDEIVG